MHIHEFQAKALLAEAGVPVPAGEVAEGAEAAASAAQRLGGECWMVKAQVHAGGRGKAGGIVRAESLAAVRAAAGKLLGSRLVTAQTDRQGQPVERVLIERAQNIQQELYLACTLDRAAARVTLVAARAGGMDIEAVAHTRPQDIVRASIDPNFGFMPHQARRLGFALGLDEAQRKSFASIAAAMVRLFVQRDLSLVEINPLAIDANGALLALDAKIALDDNALYRQGALAVLQDPAQEDPKERAAAALALNYIALDGNIGCMVNGAGLAMATMDLIKLHGGAPANFLDVGGGTTADKVAGAFKLLCADTNVRAILVNIFGGIVRCDLIAEGIVQAAREVGLDRPVVVRLEGTNVERARELLKASGLAIAAASDLTAAAKLAVAAANETEGRRYGHLG